MINSNKGEFLMRKVVIFFIIILLTSGIFLTGCSTLNDTVKEKKYSESDGTYKTFYIEGLTEEYNNEKYDSDDMDSIEEKVDDYMRYTYSDNFLYGEEFYINFNDSKSTKRYKRFDVIEEKSDNVIGRISYDVKENKIADTLMYLNYKYIPNKEMELAYKEGEKLAKIDLKKYTIEELNTNIVDRISKITIEKIYKSQKENKLYPYEYFVEGYCEYLDAKNVYISAQDYNDFNFHRQMIKTLAKAYKDSTIYDPDIGGKILIMDEITNEEDLDSIVLAITYEGKDKYKIHNEYYDSNYQDTILINSNKQILNTK